MSQQLVYSKYAELYDLCLTVNGYRRGLKRFLSVRLPNLSYAPKILDAGCGSGLISEILLTRYPNAYLTAVDANQRMLEVFKRRIEVHWPTAARRRRINLVAGDLLTFFPRRKFDLIIAGGVLEYLPLEVALNHLKYQLEPGGWLMNVALPVNVLTKQLLGRLFYFRPYSLERNRLAFLAAGLESVTVETLGWEVFPANLTKVLISGRAPRC